MRVDANHELAKHVDIYCNGQLLDHVAWADDVEGVVSQFKLTAAGLIDTAYGEPIKQRTEGTVEIYLRPNAPDAARKLYFRVAGLLKE